MKKNTTQLSTLNPQHAAVSDSETAKQLLDQYAIVVAAERASFRERVKFGAMLILWEQCLGESRGGAGGGARGGLKGWIAKHCPEIAYATAMEYKSYAEQACKMLGGGAMATAALLGESEVTQPSGETVEVSAQIIERRDAIFEDATSRRKLEQMYFDFMKKNGERGTGNGERGGVAKSKLNARKVLSIRESATILWGDAMKPLEAQRGALYSATQHLDHDLAAGWLEELKLLCGALEKRVNG